MTAHEYRMIYDNHQMLMTETDQRIRAIYCQLHVQPYQGLVVEQLKRSAEKIMAQRGYFVTILPACIG